MFLIMFSTHHFASLWSLITHASTTHLIDNSSQSHLTSSLLIIR